MAAGVVVAVLVAAVVLPLTAGWSAPSGQKPVDRVLFTVGRLLAVSLAGLLVAGAVAWAQRVRRGEQHARTWLLASGGLLAVNLVVLLNTWPGYWLWDEYFAVENVRDRIFPSWQSSLTPLLFSTLTDLVPSGAVVVVFQVVLASVVGGSLMAWTWELCRRRWPVVVVTLLLLSPPVLLNNLYPLRLTTYSYLALAVLLRMVVQRLRPDAVRHPHVELALLLTGVAVLATWRTEGFLWLAAVPYLVLRLGAHRSLRGTGPRRWRAVAALAAGATALGLVFWLADTTEDPQYRYTASINPLSVMLQEPLRGDDLAGTLADLDSAVDLDVVRANPNATDVTAYWLGAVRPDAAAETGRYEAAYARLVLDNPGAFLRARWQTFAATNALDGHLAQVYGASTYTDVPRPDHVERVATSEAQGDVPRPWDRDLRASVVRGLLLVDSDGRPGPLAPLVWTAIPVLLLLAGGLVVTVLRRRWWWASVSGLLLAQALLVFVAAPASYFMYYLPTYVLGWTLLVLGAALGAHRPRPAASRTDAASAS
ncbi:hypothetical protein [Quadrisphaera sp. INWT6]|uniref:hypothetical protein n=1 Tax=Quadrisphaera sp. INWT6 TaxID=2596917 RepID=UPI0018924E36|nr:hypothetical protein [Quadrisphaera sp. INWT6]MBF5080350.1 hypothetical protein [Quadrisphaera sp. INWT6]